MKTVLKKKLSTIAPRSLPGKLRKEGRKEGRKERRKEGRKEIIYLAKYTYTNFSIQFNSLFQTHLRSISHNNMSQHNRNMQMQHINDSLCSLAYTLVIVMDI